MVALLRWTKRTNMRKETRDDVLAYVQGMATLLGVDININVTWNKEPIQIITYNPETDCAILSLSEQIFYATPHDFYRSISALIASVFDKKLQHLWSLFDEGKLKKQDLQEQAFKLSKQLSQQAAYLANRIIRPE